MARLAAEALCEKSSTGSQFNKLAEARQNGELSGCHGIPADEECAMYETETVSDTTPDLTGRKARCACGALADSDPGLAFFEYRGPGSPDELSCKNCGIRDHAGREVWTKCQNYEPHGPWEFDSYYCGCRGWD
jgi:hypothetical protein